MNKIEIVVLIFLYLAFMVCSVKSTIESSNLTLLNEVIACQDRINMETINRSRNYVVTGYKEEKERYNEVSSIANGPGSWMSISFYPPMEQYSTKSLSELYDMFTLYDNEVEYMKQANKLQQEVMFTEITAMNWYDGLEDNENQTAETAFKSDKSKQFIRFTKEIENDKKTTKQKEAVNLLYSQEYINSINRINKLMDTGSSLLLKRQIKLVLIYNVLKYVILSIIVIYHGYTYYLNSKLCSNKNSLLI
jgi:hypothetical protein